MAPIIDASWRRSGPTEQLELASKRSAIIYAKTDELFRKRADSSSSKSEDPTEPKSTPTLSRETSIEASSYRVDDKISSSAPAPSRSGSSNRASGTSTASPSSTLSASSTDNPISSSSRVLESSSSTLTYTSVFPTFSPQSVSSTTDQFNAMTSSSSDSSASSSTVTVTSGSFALATGAVISSNAGPVTGSSTPLISGNVSAPAVNKTIAVASGAQAVQVSQPKKNIFAIDSEPTPTVNNQAAQAAVTFTTVDENGQTITETSTVLSTSTSGVNVGSNYDSSKPNTGLIAGAVIGAVLALLLVFACIFFVNRRSRKRRELEASTKPYPFTAQRSDIENQRAAVVHVSGPIRRGPSSAFASRFGSDADRNSKPRPPALPLKDQVVSLEESYENVTLSPEKTQTQVGLASVAAAAHNPFAEPTRETAMGDRDASLPKTPGSRGYNKGLERVRGADIIRSASTRTLTNTQKIVGLPSGPKSAVKTPRTGNVSDDAGVPSTSAQLHPQFGSEV